MPLSVAAHRRVSCWFFSLLWRWRIRISLQDLVIPTLHRTYLLVPSGQLQCLFCDHEAGCIESPAADRRAVGLCAHHHYREMRNHVTSRNRGSGRISNPTRNQPSLQTVL
ncbi:hypothetical protein LZ31DRAFT_549255 [Colletotrichum somersetense]|nr:hypothetical protein LZ31DRAFT_549255 [Colletotrichum somersetense]